MATIKRYIVRRMTFAKSKADGTIIHVSPAIEEQIPHLLTKSDIAERVKTGALEEVDTGIEETTPEDIEAAELLEEKAEASGSRRKNRS